MNKTVIIFILIAVAIAAGFGVYFYVFNKREATAQDWLNFLATKITDDPAIQAAFPNNLLRLDIAGQKSWYGNLINPGDDYTKTFKATVGPKWDAYLVSISAKNPSDITKITKG